MLAPHLSCQQRAKVLKSVGGCHEVVQLSFCKQSLSETSCTRSSMPSSHRGTCAYTVGSYLRTTGRAITVSHALTDQSDPGLLDWHAAEVFRG